MKTKHVIAELEETLRQLGLDVRRGQGRFRGGCCTVKGEDIVVLNQNHPPEVHLSVLAEALRSFPMDTIFLRPAVRKAVEVLWEESDQTLAGE